MKREIAEARVAQALAWLAGRDDLMGMFLGASGIAAGDLRAGAARPEVLAAVLDFVLMEDAWVIDCAAALALPPGEMAAVRAALPGGDLPHWT